MSVRSRDIERLAHHHGQALRSVDLNDQLHYDSVRQRWHDRAIHHAYGVAVGLEVGGLAGEEAVRVGPGLAYDACGRELLLDHALRIPHPTDEGAWELALDGAGPGPRSLSLAWRRRRQGTTHTAVILAIGHRDAPGKGDGEAGFRLEADHPVHLVRPLARPLIGHGSTVRGQTAWQPVGSLTSDAAADPGVIHFTLIELDLRPMIEVRIDTSDVGFTERPCYFAWLSGDPYARLARGYVPLPIESITAVQADSFVLRVWDARHTVSPQTNVITSLLELALRELAVCWIGIQMRPAPALPTPPSESEEAAHDCC